MTDRQAYDWLLSILCFIPYLLLLIGLCAPARRVIKRKPPAPPKEQQ